MDALLASLGEWLDPATIWPVVLGWSGRIFAALLIFLIGSWIAARIANAIVRATERAGVDRALTRFLRSVVFATLLVLVALAAADTLGVETTNFLAILGAAGLAIGLALKDSLSNFSSGVMLVFFRPFKAGDYVEAAGVGGTVDSISMFSTILRTPDNRVVIVPNSQIYADSITNFSAEPTRRIDLVIGVGYGDNVTRAKEIIQSVLAAEGRVLRDPAAVIMMLELGESSVNFAVRPWVATADYWAARGDLLEGIKLALEDNGLSIPFPQRDVHLIGKS